MTLYVTIALHIFGTSQINNIYVGARIHEEVIANCLHYYLLSLQKRTGAAAAGEDGPRGGAEADPRRHQRHGEHHQAVRGQQEERSGEI